MDQKSSPSPLRATLLRERSIRSLAKLQKLFESFSITEKTIFLAAAGIFALGALSLVYKVSAEFMVEVPVRGGSLSEGIVGTPRFINPLLAVSDADRDLVSLVYSGLLKPLPDGGFAPDLAERWSVSPDGLTYSFTLRKDAVFQDGTPITTDDVEFTIQKAQDSALKSPKKAAWDGVTVNKTGPYDISFILKQPYAPFVSSLTLGILPKHIWKSFESDQFPFSSFNIEPVGSGPYSVKSVARSSQGVPESITLAANPRYEGGEPYISALYLSFFSNETALADALKRGEIESASNLSPATASELSKAKFPAAILRAPLTRVFGVFFNQNSKEIFAHKEVRKALEAAVDKEAIINDILFGYAVPADGPLPLDLADRSLAASVLAASTTASSSPAASATSTASGQMLSKAGWKFDRTAGVFGLKGKTGTSTLSFSLSTANIADLVEAAHSLQADWSAIGAQTDVKVFEPSDLNQSVIRPRKYDALLFGMVTGRTPDLYPFWHSSQRNDPGLNISLYTNRKADALLESMREATDQKSFKSLYAKLEAEISADTGAIFLWSPDFIYVVPQKLQGVSLGWITTSSDRFLGIEKWYVAKEKVWRIFADSDEDIIQNN